MSHLDRIVNWFRRNRLEHEFDEELRFHLNERSRRNVAAGMEATEAERAARVRFGSIENAKAGMRTARFASHRLVALSVWIIAATMAASAAYWRAHHRIYELSPGMTAPVPVLTRNPAYTVAAMRAKIQGSVEISCVVRLDGVCANVTIVRSLDHAYGLDDEAVRAVRDWRFRPGLRKGTPVLTRIHLNIRFALR